MRFVWAVTGTQPTRLEFSLVGWVPVQRSIIRLAPTNHRQERGRTAVFPPKVWYHANPRHSYRDDSEARTTGGAHVTEQQAVATSGD